MTRLRYLTPFAFLSLLPLGGWLGGPWTFTAAAATIVCLPLLDSTLGQHEQLQQPASAFSRWLPRIYIVLQLALMVWIAIVVSRPGIKLLDAVGLAMSAGVTTGVFGFVTAHDMIHRERVRDRRLGITLFAIIFYMHFHIAHVNGHHRQAATDADPTSARLGEGLYAFALRSVAGQFREAWVFEVARQKQQGRSAFALGNRMMRYLAIEAALLIALTIISWRALAVVLVIAAIAVALLEAFNYIAHYGLRRGIGPDGRVEPFATKHSWNSKRRMDNAVLFKMGCHSDHHCQPSAPFERLQSISGAPELPLGYAVALLTALFPPIWRQVMDKRAIAAMEIRSEPFARNPNCF